jgi:hypothetical protein
MEIYLLRLNAPHPSTLECYFFRIAGFVGWIRRLYAVTQHDQPSRLLGYTRKEQAVVVRG